MVSVVFGFFAFFAFFLVVLVVSSVFSWASVVLVPAKNSRPITRFVNCRPVNIAVSDV